MLATPGLANTTSGLRLSLAGMANAGKDQKIPMQVKKYLLLLILFSFHYHFIFIFIFILISMLIRFPSRFLQWCMPTAGVVLFSVDLPAVSNARGSVDYATQGRENSSMASTWPNTYAIGAAGLLFWAVDLPLSKDIIWTTSTQPGSPEQAPASQPNFEMDTALAVLSLGPVGIADGMGMTNVTLVNRTCRSDGVLLKPSKTLTAIDSTFVPVKWNDDAKPYVGFLPLTPDGDCTRKRPCSPSVYQTHSAVSGTTWHQLLSIHVGSFHPQRSDFFPEISAQKYIMRESRWSQCKNGSTYAASKCAVMVSPSSLPDITTGPHRVDSSGAVSWKLFTLAPVLSNGWTLLGETTKFVPVSPVRFLSVDARGPCVVFTVSMAGREVITVGAVGPSNIYHSKILTIVKAGVVTGSFCGN